MLSLETVVEQRLKEFESLKDQAPQLKLRVAESEKALSECDIGQDPTAYFRAQDDLKNAQLEYKTAQNAEASSVEYLLSTTPYIRDYLETGVDSNTESPRRGSKSMMDQFVEVTGETRRNDVFHKYLVHVERSTDVPVVQDKKTNDEYGDEMCACGTKCVFDSRESMLVCESCGSSRPHTYSSTRNLSYTEEVNLNTISAYSYKRFNHLQEWLSTLQAKQNTDIPESVIEGVKNEFKKQRTSMRGDIKPGKVREFLKKLGLSKYYEHTALITNMLNGVPPPQLPAELEAKIKTLFLQIQAPFQKHCPASRTNFLSYSFVLHKLVTLLGYDEYVIYFPLLKSTEKLWACEKIWKSICHELNWEYISS
jgi:hypothetical protein